MEQSTDNTEKIKELTYEEWKELSDRLDKIQAALDKLCSTEAPKKKEDKKWNSPQNALRKSLKKKWPPR